MKSFSGTFLAPLGVCALTLLVGCGGGGGGGGGNAASGDQPPIAAVVGTPADLSDPAMSNKVAADAPDAVSAGMSLNDTASDFRGLVAAAPVASAGSKHIGFALLGQKLAQFSFAQAARRSTALAAATQSQETPCDGGGSLSATATLQNDNSINQGDEVVVTFVDCKTELFQGETDTLNGRIRMTVIDGLNIDPWKNLANATLAFELLPFTVTTQSGSSTYTGGSYGAFVLKVDSSSQVRITPLASLPTLTTQERINGQQHTTTLSSFDISVSTNGYISTVSGYATVDTTRVTALSGGATQYTWQTQSPLTVDTLYERIYNGAVVLSSRANSSKTRITFGCDSISAVARPDCVEVARSTDGTRFISQGTYTWQDYTALR